MRCTVAKMIVFEGISGSGKSYLIDALISQNRQCEFIKWFDNGLTIDLLSNIQKMMPVSHDFFSVCYALDFYGKYKYKIEPELGRKNLILHRYIYTPLTHDAVRGSSQQFLKTLYDTSKFKEPELIVYMVTSPEEAYRRIIQTRIPSFYECGLDCFLWDDLEQAKIDYKNNVFSTEILKSYYLDFQNQIQEQYDTIFKNKTNVLKVYPKADINEYVEYISTFLQR